MSLASDDMWTPANLESDLGYHFKSPLLLKKALIHSSYAHEQNFSEDNEQMEFLGDAVLGLLVSDLLFRAHPALTEGELSKLKGFFVSSSNLVKYAEQLDLGRYLFLGKGEEKTGGRSKQALLVDAFEAIIGAIYLDDGLDAAKQLISRFMEPQLDEVSLRGERSVDFKSALQELLQARSLSGGLRYAAISETGPAHEKLFTVDVELDGKTIARGIGLTKKAAEQAAAKQALQQISQQEHGEHDRTKVHEIDPTRIL